MKDSKDALQVPETKAQIEKSKNRPLMPNVSISTIAPTLKRLPAWVGWHYKWVGEKWTKVPLQWRHWDGKEHLMHASASGPETWTDFEDIATRILFTREHLDLIDCLMWFGAGFVCSRDHRITMIDLDNCRNRQTGEIASWAASIIASLNSYTEVSPSGTGVKIYIRAVKPGPKCRTKRHAESFYGNIEIYDHSRFGAITGDRLDGTPPDVEERQSELDALYAAMFPEELQTDREPATPHDRTTARPHVDYSTAKDYSDQEILERASNAKNGAEFDRLWSGDASSLNNDRSAADFALASRLAFYCGPDASRIESLMWQSGLVRNKWRDRPNYLRSTINRALSGRTQFWQSRKFDDDIGDFVLKGSSHNGPRRSCTCEECKAKRMTDLLPTPTPTPTPTAAELAALAKTAPSIDLSDLSSPAARRVAESAAAESAARTTAAAVAAELNRMRRKAFQCPHARRIIQQHLTKRETAIFWGRCDNWGCPACASLHKQQWKETIAFRINDLEDGSTVYAGRVDRESWPTIQRRMSRGDANYFRFAPDGPDGDSPYVVFTDTAGILPAETPLSQSDAIARLSTALNIYHEPARPITSSRGWSVPKPQSESNAAPIYRRIGMVHRNISDDDIEKIAERVNTTIEDREVPRGANLRNRIYRVRSFLHRPEWSPGDVEMFHWFLLNGVMPETGWDGDDGADDFVIVPSARDRSKWRDDDCDDCYELSPQTLDLSEV